MPSPGALGRPARIPLVCKGHGWRIWPVLSFLLFVGNMKSVCYTCFKFSPDWSSGFNEGNEALA